MGYIRQEIEIVGDRKAKKVEALFDTGAFRNYVKRVFFDQDSLDEIGFRVYAVPDYAILANGTSVPGERVSFNEIRIEGVVSKNATFLMVDSLWEDVIIGAELMQELHIIPIPQLERIRIADLNSTSNPNPLKPF